MKREKHIEEGCIRRMNVHSGLWFTIAWFAGFIFVFAGNLHGQTLQDTLYVRSFILTTDVENFEPVDTVQAFATSVDPRAICHARVYNGTGVRTLRFRWFRNGESYAGRSVSIENSSRYRIYMSIEPEPGQWEVRLLDEQGAILARKSFSILEGTVQSD